MYQISCRCGASKKNFKFNIGDFYIEECCEKAGYDVFGQKKAEGMSEEELTQLTNDLGSADELTISDDSSADAPEAESEGSEPLQTATPTPSKPAKTPRVPRAQKPQEG